jgi:hypothetical protein
MSGWFLFHIDNLLIVKNNTNITYVGYLGQTMFLRAAEVPNRNTILLILQG